MAVQTDPYEARPLPCENKIVTNCKTKLCLSFWQTCKYHGFLIDVALMYPTHGNVLTPQNLTEMPSLIATPIRICAGFGVQHESAAARSAPAITNVL